MTEHNDTVVDDTQTAVVIADHETVATEDAAAQSVAAQVEYLRGT